MKERIIIENRLADLVPMQDVLGYVISVLKAGRISNGGYCYLTSFKDGVHVSANLNKNSDRFVVWQEREYGNKIER